MKHQGIRIKSSNTCTSSASISPFHFGKKIHYHVFHILHHRWTKEMGNIPVRYHNPIKKRRDFMQGIVFPRVGGWPGPPTRYNSHPQSESKKKPKPVASFIHHKISGIGPHCRKRLGMVGGQRSRCVGVRDLGWSFPRDWGCSEGKVGWGWSGMSNFSSENGWSRMWYSW